jgi:type IV pilus assembly protein PilB
VPEPELAGIVVSQLEPFLDQGLGQAGGIILIAGPVGSGKTRTLYACIDKRNTAETSILTAETRVSHLLKGVTQCHLTLELHSDPEATLALLTRQDADLICVDEIRNESAAAALMRSALAGRKFLATLAAADSVGALLRLMNMGIDEHLIAATINGVLAQQLVRRVCDHCAESHQITPREMQRIGWNPLSNASGQFKVARGCQHCGFTGYAGQIAVCEFLLPSAPLREAILARRSGEAIRQLGIESAGLVTMLEDGLAKAAEGLTTVDEVFTHIPRTGNPRSLQEIQSILKPLVSTGR